MTEAEHEQRVLDTSIKVLFLLREENEKKLEHLKRSEYHLLEDAVSIAKGLVGRVLPPIDYSKE